MNLCNHCKQETKRQKYCSQKCYLQSSKVQLVCAFCNASFVRIKSKTGRGKYEFCSLDCKSKSQKVGLHPTRFLKNLVNPSCIECGDDRKFLLVIHHIDGNRKNNCIDNYEILCSNCHITRHLRESEQGAWVYDSKYLTPRNLIKEGLFKTRVLITPVCV